MKKLHFRKFLLLLFLAFIPEKTSAMEKKEIIKDLPGFIFNKFHNQKDCENFIDQFHNQLSFFMTPLMSVITASHTKSTENTSDFRETCNEAARFLIYKNDGQFSEGEKAVLFLTVNPNEISDASKHHQYIDFNNYPLNAELALLFLEEMKVDPFKKGSTGITFEDIIDALYQGSEKLPQIESRNCNNFWNRWANTECNDIIQVRDAIKKLKKQNETAEEKN